MTGFYMKCNTAQKCSSVLKCVTPSRVFFAWHKFYFCHKVVKISEGNFPTLTALIVGRGFVTTLFMKTPTHIFYLVPPFSNFAHPIPPFRPLPPFLASNLHFHCSLCYLVSLAEGEIGPHFMLFS